MDAMLAQFFIPLSDDDQHTLLEVARHHIRLYLVTGKPVQMDEARFSKALQQPAGNYVRLVQDGKTRGHIGSLSPQRTLISSISQHAYDAAFEDPRFPPLCREEESQIRIEITVLTPPEPLPNTSHHELLEQLTPGRDGVILRSGVHHAHYLPPEWEQFSRSEELINALKIDAGLTSTGNSNDTIIERFQTVRFSD